MELKSVRLLLWHKILILLAGPIIALTFGLAFVTWESLMQAGKQIGAEGDDVLSRQTENFMEKIVKGQAANLDLQLFQARTAALYGAAFIKENLEQMNRPDEILLTHLLPNLLKGTSNTSTAYFVSASDRLYVYSSGEGEEIVSPAFNMTKEEFFPRLSNFYETYDSVIWSRVHINPLSVSYDLVVDAVTPVVVEGAVQGYVGISLSLTKLIAQFSQYQPIRGGCSFLIDTDYQLVGAPPHARVELSPPERYVPRGPIDLKDTDDFELAVSLRNMVLGGSFVGKMKSGGKLKYLACHPLKNINWRLGLLVPVSIATAASGQLVKVVQRLTRKALTEMLIWACLLLAASLLVGAALTRQLTRPLREMARSARTIAGGQFDRPVKITSRDEIGELASAFNIMNNRIQIMIVNLERVNRELFLKNEELENEVAERRRMAEEVRKLNEELELRVEKRTAELRTLNKSLEYEIENRKIAEENLKKTNDALIRAKAAAESSTRAKSAFLANMSHEIRTPMNGIIGMCDLVMTTNPDRRQREYLNIIRTSARSLLGLLNDILDLSKIEAGKFDFDEVPFSLRELVDEVCNMFLEKMAEKHIELVVDIAPQIPSQVTADPLRLRQILLNLTANAFKFTDKGEICIHCSVNNAGEHADCHTELTELLFYVRDTGIGIAPEIRDELFNVFIQADDSMSRKYGGTGLGLAICKKIVQMMDGEIWAESEPGKGSTFYFTAKFKFDPAESFPLPDVPDELRNLKVLVAEDSPAGLPIITRFLESFGFRTETALSGEEALRVYEKSLETGKFDLILMDVSLPGIDGITASERIKKDINAPPIILSTVFGEDKEIHRANEIGIEAYLVKPVRQSQLFDAIMEVFGYKTAHPEIIETDTDLIRPKAFSDIRMLLAEDHPVNRRVATELLKMAGISVDTAVNGTEAVEAVKKNSYDAVMMDIQMPEMDGIEATKQIRNWEDKLKIDRCQLSVPSIPIIAMTAHAMPGDREKCLRAGMNDYIAKPIDRKELFSVLKRNLRIKAALHIEASVSQFPMPDALFSIPDAVLDIREGLDRLGGSWNIYSDILKEFCDSQRDFLPEFRKLIENKDFETARVKAHALKGAAGNVSAIALRNAAKDLEVACADRNKDHILSLLPVMAEKIEQVSRASEKIIAGLQTLESEPREADHDSSKISDRFQALRKYLQEFDPVGSESCLKEIRAGFSAASFQSDLELLESRIKCYNFEAALELLESSALSCLK